MGVATPRLFLGVSYEKKRATNWLSGTLER